MSKRKDHLKALFGSGPLPGEAPSPARAPETKSMPQDKADHAPAAKSAAPSAPAPGRTSSGAIKAMGLSLNSVNQELQEARALKESLARGEQVVEIDPARIDPSLVRDRLSHEDQGDEAFNALVESMRESGQQVPVLLRPHPTAQGRYQVAYGHRRVRACMRLERPVRAIVRELSDDELVLAQGKENTERRNLSFIEKAFFAHGLIAHGFDRGIVQNALSLHKAEMTRLLAVAGAVPADIARAIGPAPKAGRPRWLSLAEKLKSEAALEVAERIIASEAFQAAGSDERFKLLFAQLSKKPPQPRHGRPRDVTDGQGKVIARYIPGPKPRLEINEEAEPGFAEFLLKRMPGLIAQAQQAKREGR